MQGCSVAEVPTSMQSDGDRQMEHQVKHRMLAAPFCSLG